jgi:hypothetical protein
MLYIDPPWGGASAEKRRHSYNDQHMRLGGKALPDLVAVALARGFGTVIIKLPRESDPRTFIKAVEQNSVAKLPRHNCHSYEICDARLSKSHVSNSHMSSPHLSSPCVRGYWLVACRL